jgi:hypothetical protein
VAGHNLRTLFLLDNEARMNETVQSGLLSAQHLQADAGDEGHQIWLRHDTCH